MTKYFLALTFLFMLLFGFSSMEKRLLVNVQSADYLERSIDIESITNGLVSETMFYSIPDPLSKNNSFYKMIVKDSVFYLSQQCRFNTWIWQDSAWVDLYKFDNKGWCIPSFYIHNDDLIGYTGSGFWTALSGLYFFDKNSGGWELLATQNDVTPFVSYVNFRLGQDTIVSIIGNIHENGEGEFLPPDKNFGLDLNQKKWFQVKFDFSFSMFKTYSPKRIVDFENTVKIFSSDFQLIIDKRTLKMYSIKNKVSFLQDDFYYNDCSKAYYINKFSRGFLFDEIPEGTLSAGEIFFSEIDSNQVKKENIVNLSFLWGILLLISGVFIGLVFFKIKRKKEKLPTNELSEQVKVLVMLSDSLKSSEEIDKIFKIDNEENPDARRVKRSRIIQEVNQEYQFMAGKELIIRHRDPKDKRYVLYKIKK